MLRKTVETSSPLPEDNAASPRAHVMLRKTVKAHGADLVEGFVLSGRG